MLPATANFPIRAKVALAIFAMSVGAMVVMAAAVYAAFESELRENLDDTIRLRAASNLQLVSLAESPPRLNAGPDPGNDRIEGDAVLRLFAANGELLQDASPAVPVSAAEQLVVSRAARELQDVYVTVNLPSGHDFRAIVSPVVANGQLTGILVTGVERSQLSEPLAVLRLILAIAVPATSVILAIGSYFIARSAMKPVARISATARQITKGDLTRRIEGVRAKDEIGELSETLNTMIGRLADTVGRERRFTADASHELRTPLAAIETSIDVTLGQERGAADYRHTLEVVRGQAHRLTRLTRQLLLLSRLDADQARAEFEVVDLGGLVERVAAAFSDANPGAAVGLAVLREPLLVRGDSELLARALMNILENAVLHGGEGVTISVSVAKGRVPGRAEVIIEDDGPGISPALRAEIFQRFRRGDASRSRGGSGLGLAIVEGIALLHEGGVELEAGGRGGARFILQLPVHN